MQVDPLCVILVLLAVDLTLDGSDESISFLDHVPKGSTLGVQLSVLVLKLSKLVLQTYNLECVGVCESVSVCECVGVCESVNV